MYSITLFFFFFFFHFVIFIFIILTIVVSSLFGLYIIRWWRDLKITEKMSFFRDRLVENTLWNLGMVFEPQHAYCRIMESKVFNFMAMLDDTYDTYGALHELELLTTAFERSGT